MMWRQAFLSLALVGGCAWCLVVVQQVYSEEKAATREPRPCYQPVAPIHDLMEAQGDLFKKIADTVRTRKADAEAKDAEAAAKDFKHIKEYANVLAELSNVNQYQSDKPDYRRWAVEARDQLLEVARAAEKRDLPKVEELSRRVNTTCGACHEKYQKDH